MEYRLATTAAALFAPKTRSDKETYAGSQDANTVASFTAFAVVLIIVEIVFYIVLGSLAAYLSWTSNTTIGWHPAMCVIFALIAFVCSSIYISGHILFKIDLLSAITALKVVSRVVQAPRSSNAPR